MKLLNVIETATVCPRNPDTHFISFVEKRGGSIRGERGSGNAIINKHSGKLTGFVDLGSVNADI